MSMLAFRLEGPERVALRRLPRPVPQSGELLLRVGASAFCHSDVHHVEATLHPPGMEVPVTMGHELAGWVEELGAGVNAPKPGTPVAVYLAHGCGACTPCSLGEEHLCDAGLRVPGVHFDGGMAEFVVVGASNVVDASGLDLGVAAALTDAGVTAHHSIGFGLTAIGVRNRVLVIGVGGLGHLAIQILRALTDAEVVAVDLDATRLDLARRLGAHAAYLASEIDDVFEPGGVDAVFDFVGAPATIATSCTAVRREGALVVAGLAGGSVTLVAGQMLPTIGPTAPRGTNVVFPTLGARSDLAAVLELARQDRITVQYSSYPLERADEALRDVRASRVLGRAVVMPEGHR
jgi:propanol-preferring alcohol dehydrogenase